MKTKDTRSISRLIIILLAVMLLLNVFNVRKGNVDTSLDVAQYGAVDHTDVHKLPNTCAVEDNICNRNYANDLQYGCNELTDPDNRAACLKTMDYDMASKYPIIMNSFKY